MLAVLLAIEVGLRFFGLASPILYRLDAVTGYEPLPNQTSSRLGVAVHINDAGRRDKDSPQEPQRPPPLALATFTRLALGFVNGRYRITERVPALGVILPAKAAPIDTLHAIDLNLEAVARPWRRTVSRPTAT
jgi:hypothetical protein